MTDPLGTYVIAAGGTGGHIIPGIALATEIRTHKPTAEVLFVGTGQGLEQQVMIEHHQRRESSQPLDRQIAVGVFAH